MRVIPKPQLDEEDIFTADPFSLIVKGIIITPSSHHDDVSRSDRIVKAGR